MKDIDVVGVSLEYVLTDVKEALGLGGLERMFTGLGEGALLGSQEGPEEVVEG